MLDKVSIIVRSMARDCLREALESVANAALVPLEVILVNALGGIHELPTLLDERLDLRLVNQGGPALDRAPAANLGLAESTGRFVLFLDDDDLIDADHLARLHACLQENPAAVAAYTGVRLFDAEGQVLRELNEPWEPERLLGMNFLPIHAVMFRAEKVRGCVSFDPSLRLMEDWDFWLQLVGLGDFIRLPGCSATYRLQHGESGLSGLRDKEAMYFAHALVLDKIRLADVTGVSRALFWFDTALSHVQGEKTALAANLESANAYVAVLEHRVRAEEASAMHFRQASETYLNERDAALIKVDQMLGARDNVAIALATTQDELVLKQGELVTAQNELATAQSEFALKRNELAMMQNELTNAHASLARILESTSWKITAPLRAFVLWIRSWGKSGD